MLIEKVIGKIEEIEVGGRTVDKVCLSSDEISKPHQKAMTEAGEELKISLTRGENLFCGAVLYEDDSKIIVVDMPEEKVFELRPKTHMQWAKAAFNIGNMHQRAYLYEDCIKMPYDHVLEKMVQNLAVEYKVTMGKLNGVRANDMTDGQSAHGHSHSHDHEGGHTHPHDHTNAYHHK